MLGPGSDVMPEPCYARGITSVMVVARHLNQSVTVARARILAQPTLPCRAVPCRAVPCRAVPCRAVPCRAVPCRAVPCRAVPCRAVPCRAVPHGSDTTLARRRFRRRASAVPELDYYIHEQSLPTHLVSKIAGLCN